MGPSERKGQDERGLFVETLQERFPDLAKQFDIEGFAKDYHPLFPGAIPLKLFGGLMGLLRGKTSPVVATIMIHGEKKNIHADGSISEIRAGDQTTEDADLYKEPLPVQTAREGLTSTVKEDEEDKGIAALLASIKDKEHLLAQFNNIVEAGFSKQEAANMLGVPLDTFIT